MNTLFSGGAEVRPIIYGLVDPDDPARVRYVGQTVRPYLRYCGHVSSRRNKHLGVVGHWIRNLYLNHSRVPSMVLLEEVGSEKDLRAREREWIGRLTAIGQADLNRGTDGRAIIPQSYFGPDSSKLSA